MPQSLSQVYVHITFSTKDRTPWIDDNIMPEMFKYIGGVCKNLKCYPMQVGGFNNHIHMLCQLSRVITQAKLMEEVKKNSSLWVKKQGSKY